MSATALQGTLNRGGGVRELPLSQGLVALVDLADFDWLNVWKWSARASGHTHYAHRHAKIDGRWTSVILHRVILSAPVGVLVDHRNGDGLDCRRENMRLCNNAENSANIRRGPVGAIPYRGVYIWKRCAGSLCFKAQIAHENRKIGLGYFDTAIEAARAYDRAARELKGDFAVLNFPALGLAELEERRDAALDRSPVERDLFEARP